MDYSGIHVDTFSLVCKQEYDGKKIESELSAGVHAVVSVIRTDNLYPIGHYAEAIAYSIIELYQSDSSESVELLFDDLEQL